MRRSKFAVAVLAMAIPPLSSLALADEAPPSATASTASSAPASASSPAPPVTPPVTTATAPLPSSTPIVTQLPPAAPAMAWAVTEDDPLRLLQLIRGEAGRQKAARIGGAITSIVVGAGVVTTGALLLGASDDTYYKVFGWVTVGMGVLTGVSSLISFFGGGALERFADAYAPIAEDTSIPASVRRSRGEETLRALAANEKSLRTINGVSGIILGVAVGALGVGLALSLDVGNTFRIPLAVAAGFAGVSAVSSGIGDIAWRRGPAEVAIEHWDAARGAPSSAKLRLDPILAPLPGGGFAGLALSY